MDEVRVPGKLTDRIAAARWGEPAVLALIFAVAMGLRVAYLFQISHAPFFDAPYGDPGVYYNRALEILRGDLLPNAIPFHSSPPYPYFIALLLGVSGSSFFFLYLVQSLFGAANCLLIYALAKRLSGGNIIAGALAGALAAGYGLLAFFDGDILMISLTVFFTDLGLLLLLKARETGRGLLAAAAGFSMGMAVLDKVNILVFVPAALLFLASGLRFRGAQWAVRPPAFFLAALGLTILPVTIQNYAVGRDLVLVSSNGGVNFFIGNNPAALGIFNADPGSGLTDPGLEGSSTATAERALGRRLKPSEVSRYWAGKALAFYRGEPRQALRLLGRKLLLLLNYFEMPNHIGFDFVKSNYAPALKWMFVGYWMIAPLALTALAWRLSGGLAEPDRLLLAFLGCYALTLLAFFITERYRLPLVPVLIALAAVCVTDFVKALRARPLAATAFFGGGILIFGLVVNAPAPLRFQFTLDRTAVGVNYLGRAERSPGERDAWLKRAAVTFKRVLETDPGSWFAHHNLGFAYESLGHYSGAIREYARALELYPPSVATKDALANARFRYARAPDRLGASAVPPTPFEEALALKSAGRPAEAFAAFERVVEEDPFHAGALRQMGLIRADGGRGREAARLLKRALKLDPVNPEIRAALAEVERNPGTQR